LFSLLFSVIALGEGRYALAIVFDSWAAPGVHGTLSPAWRPLFVAVSFLGGAPFLFSATTVIAILLWRAGAKRRAESLVIGVIGAALLVQVFKILIHRARPRIFEPLASAVGFAFPSGHSATSAAFYGALAAIAARYSR
jgi:undecaprenyl-diphosphatase